MLEKKIVLGKIEILGDEQIQLRSDTVIIEDGIVLAKTFSRKVLAPGDDVSREEKKIQSITAVLWTPEVIQAYRDKVSKAIPS